MATKKTTPSKKGNLRDLPKSKKKLTADQAKAVKGGKKAGGTYDSAFLKYMF
jgi:hypothetical protein